MAMLNNQMVLQLSEISEPYHHPGLAPPCTALTMVTIVSQFLKNWMRMQPILGPLPEHG